MNREELNNLIRQRPCRIHVNDGRSYDAIDAGTVLVSDFAASVLYRSEADGKLRHAHIALDAITAVEPLDP